MNRIGPRQPVLEREQAVRWSFTSIARASHTGVSVPACSPPALEHSTPSTGLPGMCCARRSVIRLWLVCAVVLLLCVGCGTWLCDTDLATTGRPLEEGQTEVNASSFFVLPWTLGASRGLGHGWEVRGRLGFAGSYVLTTHMEAVPTVDPLYGFSLGATKSLHDRTPLHLSAVGEIAGFTSFYSSGQKAVHGVRTTAGLALAYYPSENFGVYLPVKLNVMLGNRQMRQLNLFPGLGLSFEKGRSVVRPALSCGIPLIMRYASYKDMIMPNTYIGLVYGYRW